MAVQLPENVQRIVDNPRPFDFGGNISRAWQILTKEAGLFIGFTIVFFLINVGCSFIPVIGQLLNSFVLGPALMVGWYLVTHKIYRNEHAEFGDFFKGFDELGNILPIVLIMVGIVIVYMIPLALLAFLLIDTLDSNPALIIGLGVIAMIPLIYIMISWSFSYHFVVFYKLRAWDAMEASRRLVSNYWWAILGYSIVVSLIGMLGILGLFIAIVFTYSIMPIASYVAFAQLTGFNENENGTDLMDHLIEA